MARVIGRESAGRVLAVAEAKIIEADPALHDERVEAERRRRYVSSSRTDEFGLRTVIARVEAGDAVWVEATVARVAEIIAPRHPDATADEVRAIAFGWLARPAELLQLLLEHRDPQEELDLETEVSPSRATAFPADLLDALKAADLSPLAPKAVLYVHLHEAAIHGVPAVARVEGLGPVTLTGLQTLLARTALTVKPVLDLSDRVRTTAYEHPESLKERVHLTTGGDYWPYATSTARNVDYDHPTAYDAITTSGRPTRPDRHPQLRPPGPATSPVQDPRRLPRPTMRTRPLRLADPTRARLPRRRPRHPTHHRKHARMILDAPPGVDIYPVAMVTVAA